MIEVTEEMLTACAQIKRKVAIEKFSRVFCIDSWVCFGFIREVAEELCILPNRYDGDGENDGVVVENVVTREIETWHATEEIFEMLDNTYWDYIPENIKFWILDVMEVLFATIPEILEILQTCRINMLVGPSTIDMGVVSN